MLKMTEFDWLNLMMDIGNRPDLARQLLGDDVDEQNFVPRMNQIKAQQQRKLAALRQQKQRSAPMKQSEVTNFMRQFVRNQSAAIYNRPLDAKTVKGLHKWQLEEEYEKICRALERTRLQSAQHNLFRPKPTQTEAAAKRQRLDSAVTSTPTVALDSAASSTATAGVVSAAPYIATAALDSAGFPAATFHRLYSYYHFTCFCCYYYTCCSA